tara:strand:+ start:437 stop:562 length:126 start_codon:yes stop_codon:yes gene_type:complete
MLDILDENWDDSIDQTDSEIVKVDSTEFIAWLYFINDEAVE